MNSFFNFNIGRGNVAKTTIVPQKKDKPTLENNFPLNKVLFISHSSKDAEIVSPFVQMLLDAGFPRQYLFYSSNADFSVPLGGEISDCLRRKLTKDTFVIFMLSDNWCNSPVCENEMGAAWHGNLPHCNVFLPGFSSRDIKDVASSTEIAITYNGSISTFRDRLGQLRRQLEKHFDLEFTDSAWEKSRDQFLATIKSYSPK